MVRPRRRVLGIVTTVVVAAAVVSCTSGEPDTAPDTVEPVTTVTSDPSAADPVAGGDGACTEALREGPLIDPEDSTLGDPPPGAEPLPIVALPHVQTCELTSTADWIGRPLVINFWASWCGPCREEMPMLDQFATDNADRLDLVGVTVDFRPDDATEFLDEVDVGFDSWLDPDGQVLAREVSVRPMPTTLFVDADGMVVHRHIGEITRAQLADAVTEHLGVETDSAE
ncbi:TlpA family protein disulfide reductase [Salsipaludibacter albus]|uniref:TlpA family protein disulfide reductase n=1 Tax=Salsipaludibacter albus TaxID=2849650 RepID=UPI001EE4D086|nr:TlpA family protein disulfide reductase [Salsipaludibacter albus]